MKRLWERIQHSGTEHLKELFIDMTSSAEPSWRSFMPPRAAFRVAGGASPW